VTAITYSPWLGAASVALAHAALVCLCLAMARHFQQVLRRADRPHWRRGLRLLGWAALAGSFGLALAAWGNAVGPVAWCGQLSLLALLLAFGLPYWPRSLCSLALPGLGWSAWAWWSIQSVPALLN
jgi:hypothetical protein